jgi:hypothetical protein
MRDFDKVKAVINHPDNKHCHMAPIHNLIFLFSKKYGYDCYEYRNSLQNEWENVNDRLFEEKLKNRKNGN